MERYPIKNKLFDYDIGEIIHSDNLEWMKTRDNESYDLIYVDVPFNTGVNRVSYGTNNGLTYEDKFDDFVNGFLRPRVVEAHRILKSTGSFYFHIDPKEGHYCKVMIDGVFGRDQFRNEIVWCYSGPVIANKNFKRKHDNIFFYSKTDEYNFNNKNIRVSYKQNPILSEKSAASMERFTGAATREYMEGMAEKGMVPNDWWLESDGFSSVNKNPKERTGYPTQKPVSILKRIILASSNPEDKLLDFFAGSGSFGDAALELNRYFTLVDQNPQAIKVMKERFKVK